MVVLPEQWPPQTRCSLSFLLVHVPLVLHVLLSTLPQEKHFLFFFSVMPSELLSCLLRTM